MRTHPASVVAVSLLSLCFLFSGVVAGAQETNDGLEDLLSAAGAAAAREDYSAAAADYARATAIDRSIPELWANRGLMEHLSGKPAEAIVSFERALRLKPALFTPTLFLGMDYTELGKPERALPYLKAAESMQPSDPQAALALGKALSAMKEYTAAAQAYGRAAALDAKSPAAWFGLGVASLAQVDADGRALSIADRNSPWARALYAESLVEQGRLNEATEVYQKLLAAPEQPPCVHSALGFVYIRRDMLPEAGSAFAAGPGSNPDAHAGCSLALLGQAVLSIAHGEDAAALRVLRDLMRRDPGFLASNFASSVQPLSREALDRFSAALTEAHANGAIPEATFAVLRGGESPSPSGQAPGAPESALHQAAQESAAQLEREGHFAACADRIRNRGGSAAAGQSVLLAQCAFLTGDYAAAAEASAAAIAHEPGSAAARYWSVRASEKRAVDAFAHFEQVAPNSAQTHVLVGDLYRHRHKTGDAINEYQQALAVTPRDPAALLGLAASYLLDARNDDAIATAKLALEAHPDDPKLSLLVAEAMAAKHQYAGAEPYLPAAFQSPPELLPHVHALLGRAYAEDGRTGDAIAQLKLGLSSDDDGSIHYQLARLYRKSGDEAASAQAMSEAKAIEADRRQRAVVAVQDAAPAASFP